MAKRKPQQLKPAVMPQDDSQVIEPVAQAAEPVQKVESSSKKQDLALHPKFDKFKKGDH